MIRSKFKTNLKYLLKENKMTSKQLSAIIGINYKKIFTHKIEIDKIEKIATLFITNSYDLTYGNVRKTPKLLRDITPEAKNDNQTMESVMQSFKIISNYKKINKAFIDSIEIEDNPFNI